MQLNRLSFYQPPAPCKATDRIFSDSFYMTLCNAMGYSCSIFPVTFVDSAIDHPDLPHQFYNHEDEDIYQLYSPNIFAGCPAG
ncbi:hypothetical protein BD779DRAFT_1553881, partial [Infundibulicybe gibba]